MTSFQHVMFVNIMEGASNKCDFFLLCCSGCDVYLDIRQAGEFTIPSSSWHAKWLSEPPSDHSEGCSAEGVLRLLPPAGTSGVYIVVELSDPQGTAFHLADSPSNKARLKGKFL